MTITIGPLRVLVLLTTPLTTDRPSPPEVHLSSNTLSPTFHNTPTHTPEAGAVYSQLQARFFFVFWEGGGGAGLFFAFLLEGWGRGGV